MAKAKSPKKPTPRQRARAKASSAPARRSPAPSAPTPAPAPAPALPTSSSPPSTALQPTSPSAIDRPAAPTGSRLSRGQKVTIGAVAIGAIALATVTLWPKKANAAANPQASAGGRAPNASTATATAPARPRTNTTPTATVLSDGLPPPDHDSQLDSDNGTRTTLHASERGLTRTQVLHYQQELFDLGASTDAVDGILGQRTRAAVRSFQNAWNARNPTRRLRVDGILGPQTRAAIDEAHTRFRDGTPADANTPGAIAIIEGNP